MPGAAGGTGNGVMNWPLYGQYRYHGAGCGLYFVCSAVEPACERSYL